jgi:hypothetical protein
MSLREEAGMSHEMSNVTTGAERITPLQSVPSKTPRAHYQGVQILLQGRGRGSSPSAPTRSLRKRGNPFLAGSFPSDGHLRDS